MNNIDSDIGDNRLMFQYEVLTNVYNSRLSGLQNVLTIQSVFTSAAIIVILSEFDIFDIFIKYEFFIDISNAYAILFTSVISLAISIASLMSFISLSKNCESIRKQLLNFESELNIVAINRKNNLKTSMVVSILILLLTVFVFLLIIIYVLKKLW